MPLALANPLRGFSPLSLEDIKLNPRFGKLRKEALLSIKSLD